MTVDAFAPCPATAKTQNIYKIRGNRRPKQTGKSPTPDRENGQSRPTSSGRLLSLKFPSAVQTNPSLPAFVLFAHEISCRQNEHRTAYSFPADAVLRGFSPFRLSNGFVFFLHLCQSRNVIVRRNHFFGAQCPAGQNLEKTKFRLRLLAEDSYPK